MRATDRLVLAAGWLLSAAAVAAPWHSVPQESELRFVARVEGDEANGAFRRFSVALDPAALESGLAQLSVRIDVTSADMSSAELNEAIADPEWFDFAGFPSARFHSDRIEALGPGRFRASGELQFKCGTRPVEVTFEWRRSETRAHMSGALELRRGDFCIGSGAWAEDGSVGQAVRVEFDVTLAP